MVFIYSTCKDIEEARRIGRELVERKLASCVNFWPIQSIYFWEGQIQEGTEVALVIKTVEAHMQEIEDFVSKNHSYTNPFIGAFDVRRVNRAYKEWMMTQIE